MTEKPRKAKKKGLFIALGAVALVAAAAVCGVLFLPKLLEKPYKVNHPHAIDAMPISGHVTAVDHTDEQGISYVFYDDGTAAAVELDKDDYPETLVIPSEVKGRTVTEIGYPARIAGTQMRLFAGRISGGYEGLKRVDIPDTVTRIAFGSFLNCEDLEEIAIPHSVQMIGPRAFEGTPWLEKQKDEFITVGDHVLIRYNGPQKRKITVPDGVRSLGGAFAYNDEVEEIVLPKSLRIICEDAIDRCYSLETLELPEGLLFLDHYSLSGFITEEIRLPDSLEEIATGALGSALGVAALESHAVRDTTITKTVVWPEKLATIWMDDFSATISEDFDVPMIRYVLPELSEAFSKFSPERKADLSFTVYVTKGSQGEKWMKEYEKCVEERGGEFVWEYSTDAPPKR